MANYKILSSLLLLTVLVQSYYAVQINTATFSERIRAIMDENLGVSRMQEHFNNLEFSHPDRDPSNKVRLLTEQITLTFNTQKSALKQLKNRIEAAYKNNNFADRSTVVECCYVDGLSSNYQFVVNISDHKSCDRITQTADESAESLYGKLDSIYIQNNKVPMKWQYFGSEKGVLNQFPASRTSSCNSTYDHRFRPWYIASATPNPKDVVLIVKNNLFLKKSIQDKQLEATDIILRTLNPKDKLAVILFNSVVVKHPSDSCYGNNLSIATPANIEKFQYFLQTRPEPQAGHNLLGALEIAYKYFENERISNTSRDRGIILFTDGERIESESEKNAIQQLVLQKNDLKVKIFIFAAVKDSIKSSVRFFYNSVISQTLEDGKNADSYYIELPSSGDLRRVMSSFYQTFSPSLTDDINNFNPVFLTPYYDVFGLDQLVLTLTTPCYKESDLVEPSLIGVAAVDLTVADLLASVEYFNAGELSYAFIIDKEGLTLFHPNLPVPSTNYTFVYMDISTLERQDNFSYVRESMISGESGCVVFNSTHVFSRGDTIDDGAITFNTPSSYCWRPVIGTPFSVCVVIPVNMNIQTSLNQTNEVFPIKDLYHRIDMSAINQNLDTCQHYGQQSTSKYSAVKFSPKSYSNPEKYLLTAESTSDAVYLQNVLNSLDDSQNQFLRTYVLGSVSASYLVNSLWINTTESYIIWRYIATVDGMLRMYPGTYVDIKNFDPLQRPWYQRAITQLGYTSVSTVYFNKVSAITLSQAILSKSCHNATVNDYRNVADCSVLGVMAIDLTWLHIWQLLQQTIPACDDSNHYRCMIIDDTGHIIMHPALFTNNSARYHYHLTQLEPFVSQDLLALEYMKRIYCNNFQYNYNFTIHPRRQYSYVISEKVSLEGGHSQFCVFYTIAPILYTNTYVIVIDLIRSSKSRCTPITCLCNSEVSCDALPANCICPCSEPMSSDNYNSCDETFTDLKAPACPVRFGLKDTSNHHFVLNEQPTVSLNPCFQPNCSGNTLISCESIAGCSYCLIIDTTTKNMYYKCMLYSECSFNSTISSGLTSSIPDTLSIDHNVMIWQIALGIALGMSTIIIIVFVIMCVKYLKLRKKMSQSYKISPKKTTDLSNIKRVEVIETELNYTVLSDNVLSSVRDNHTLQTDAEASKSDTQINQQYCVSDIKCFSAMNRYQMGGVTPELSPVPENPIEANEVTHSNNDKILERASSFAGSVSIAGGIWF